MRRPLGPERLVDLVLVELMRKALCCDVSVLKVDSSVW